MQDAPQLRKVLVVSPTPPPQSGPEIMTQHLLDSPLKKRYQLIHFNIGKQRNVATKGKFDLTNLVYGVLQPIQLFLLLSWHRPEVVYTNLAQNLPGFLRYASFILTCAILRRRVVVRVMGDGFNHFYARSRTKWQIRLILSLVTRFIVRSEALRAQLDGVVSSEKIHVVFSGIPTEEFNRPDLVETTHREIRVLFVGYLTKAKGAHDLVMAASKVIEQIPDAHFYLMGAQVDIERNVTFVGDSGRNTTTLATLLRSPGLQKHVHLLGVQTGDAKIRTFINSDIFVMPSYSEATPLVALEAMAAQLPVIATPVGLLPQAFDERNILFFGPGDVDGLANAIITLSSQPTIRRKIGEFNKRAVETQFNLASYANRLDELFQELL